MGFSAKTDYGLIALMDLAEASGSGQLLQTREISLRHDIPERYLEQTLTSLRKGGFLRSLRGPRGGFELRLPPEDIRISEVVACLEGNRRPEQGRKRHPGIPCRGGPGPAHRWGQGRGAGPPFPPGSVAGARRAAAGPADVFHLIRGRRDGARPTRFVLVSWNTA